MTPGILLSPHQVNDYNVPGGKLNRGMAVYDVIAAIKGAEVGGLPCAWQQLMVHSSFHVDNKPP